MPLSFVPVLATGQRLEIALEVDPETGIASFDYPELMPPIVIYGVDIHGDGPCYYFPLAAPAEIQGGDTLKLNCGGASCRTPMGWSAKRKTPW